MNQTWLDPEIWEWKPLDLAISVECLRDTINSKKEHDVRMENKLRIFFLGQDSKLFEINGEAREEELWWREWEREQSGINK